MRRLLIYGVLFLLNGLFATDPSVVLLTLPIAMLIIAKASSIRERSLSIDDMYCFIPFLFFVIGPIQSLSEGRFKAGSPASSLKFSDAELLIASLIVFVFYFFSFFSEKRFTSILKKRGARSIDRMSRSRITPVQSILLLTTVSMAAFGAYVFASGGLGNLLTARFERDSEQVALGASFFLAVQSVSTIILFSYTARKVPGGEVLKYFCAAVVAALLLLAVNPINSPRFFIVAAWLPVFLALIQGRFSAGSFYLLAMFGAIVAMPILNLTTRFGLDGLDVESIFNQTDVLYIPFLDVFNTLCFAVRYAEDNGFFFGQNALAILFFFVPRFIWESKPYPGGYLIGQSIFGLNESGTENLSFFVGGDFYLDFGLLGVALAGVIFGRLVASAKASVLKAINGQNLLEYIFIASLPILIRGPIASVLLLFFFQVIALVGLRRIVLKTTRA